MNKWTNRFLDMTSYVAQWSTCLRRQCGAVIVKDKQILATGYNGAPAGCVSCKEIGSCIRQDLGVPSGQRAELCRATHAEQNALVQAAKHGVSIDKATLYVTGQPCAICAKLIINAGISEVVYRGDYPDELALALFKEANIKVTQVE